MALNVHVYRYGEAKGLPGLSIGVTRHLPRGVRKDQYGERGYFDVWFPSVSPTHELLARFLDGKMTFDRFRSAYRTQMKRPEPRHAICLLAAVAQHQRINLGCFCEDPARCHRTLLAELIREVGAQP